MRGGWNDTLTHAHLAMFVTGMFAGALLVGIAWVLVAA